MAFPFEKSKTIEGEGEGGFDETVPSGKKVPRAEKMPANLKQYQEEAQKMLDAHRLNFMTYARDVSLRFRMSNQFMINYETGEVHLDTRWFAKKNMTPEQIRWAVLHELTHFVDFREDRVAMTENFDYIFARAKKTGERILKKIEEKFGTSDPAFLDAIRKQSPVSPRDPSKTVNAAEAGAYKIHHTFFNCIDDVYVNKRLERRAPVYASKAHGGKEVRRLYQEELFRGTDYSKLPHHLQFLYALLRNEMVLDEELVIHDDVRWALDEMPVRFRGKTYTARQIIEKFIKPKSVRKTNAGERYDILKQTLEPIFDDLLNRDLDEWDPQKPPEQKPEGNGGEKGESGEQESEKQKKEGKSEPQEPNSEEQQEKDGNEKNKPQEQGQDVNPFSDFYREFEENSPDQIDEGDIQAWAEAEEKKEEERKKEVRVRKENKNIEEGQQHNAEQEESDKQWSVKEGIDYDALREFRAIEREVAPYRKELSRLWRQIVYGRTTGLEVGIEGHFPTGTEPDIEEVVEKWPEIQKRGGEQAEIMLRAKETEKEIEKPELIRFRVVGDMSDSMREDYGEKKRVLQRCVVLLLSSFQEFQTYLNLTRRTTKTKLDVDTEAWIFGNAAKRIKRFRKEAGVGQEQKELVTILQHLQMTIGGTYDHMALSRIEQSITPEEEKKIQKKKIMEIVIEITDGGSSNADAAREGVNRLSKKGVIMRAFQVGDTSSGEREVFNYVWNGGEEKRGEIVGTNIANLIPAVVRALKQFLRNVRV